MKNLIIVLALGAAAYFLLKQKKDADGNNAGSVAGSLFTTLKSGVYTAPASSSSTTSTSDATTSTSDATTSTSDATTSTTTTSTTSASGRRSTGDSFSSVNNRKTSFL